MADNETFSEIVNHNSGAMLAHMALTMRAGQVAMPYWSSNETLDYSLRLRISRLAIEAVNTENRGAEAEFPSASKSTQLGVEAHSLRQDDFDRDVWCMLGMPVDIADINQAVAAIDEAVRTDRRLSFVTPNVNWLARAAKDKAVRRELINADLSLVDGAPLAAMARRLSLPIRSRVAGSDLFEALRRRPSYGGRRLKVFFFGGRDGAAEAAAKAINEDNGGVEAVGWLNPGFGDVEDMSRPEFFE